MVETPSPFVRRAVRRKNLFLLLALAGIGAAVLLTAFYAIQRWSDPAYALGTRSAVVVLVLLNARQNLRQYRYAGALEALTQAPCGPGERPAGAFPGGPIEAGKDGSA